jgi:hypothetical protein
MAKISYQLLTREYNKWLKSDRKADFGNMMNTKYKFSDSKLESEANANNALLAIMKEYVQEII